MSDSPTTEPDPLIGHQIRHLQIIERIGQGGMGAVYKAEHVLLHELRALKVLRTEWLGLVPNAVELERFQREARIAVKLRHPNLVLLYDFFVEEDRHFLVMEYVMGTSLAAFLREHGALSVEGTRRIGIQCCAGLAHAQSEAKPALAPAPKPASAKPRVVAFANEGEMQRAFDAALEFERTHAKVEAIANWKEFRGRLRASSMRRRSGATPRSRSAACRVCRAARGNPALRGWN